MCALLATALPGASGAAAGPPSRHAWAQSQVTTLTMVQWPVQVPGTPYAYAVAVAPVTPTRPGGRLVRIDLVTGQLAKGPQVLSASQLLVAGKSVALLSPARTAANGVPQGPYSLRLASGLNLGPAVRLGWTGQLEDPVSGAGSLESGGIWLPTAEGAQLVSVSSGKVLKNLSFGARVTGVATSPDGTLLYVSLFGPEGYPSSNTVIDEVDAGSGRVVARRGLFTVNGAALTPVPGALWASYRTGMAGGTDLYSSTGLDPVAPPEVKAFSAVPRYGGEQIQGFSMSYLGAVVWMQSASGVSCLSPSTGSFRAGIAFSTTTNGSQAWSPFATWDGLVYAVAGIFTGPSHAVVAVRPPATCGL